MSPHISSTIIHEPAHFADESSTNIHISSTRESSLSSTPSPYPLHPQRLCSPFWCCARSPAMASLACSLFTVSRYSSLLSDSEIKVSYVIFCAFWCILFALWRPVEWVLPVLGNSLNEGRGFCLFPLPPPRSVQSEPSRGNSCILWCDLFPLPWRMKPGLPCFKGIWMCVNVYGCVFEWQQCE